MVTTRPQAAGKRRVSLARGGLSMADIECFRSPVCVHDSAGLFKTLQILLIVYRDGLPEGRNHTLVGICLTGKGSSGQSTVIYHRIPNKQIHDHSLARYPNARHPL